MEAIGCAVERQSYNIGLVVCDEPGFGLLGAILSVTRSLHPRPCCLQKIAYVALPTPQSGLKPKVFRYVQYHERPD